VNSQTHFLSRYNKLIASIPAILVGGALLALGIFVDHLNISQEEKTLREVVHDQLSTVRAKLEGNINSNIHLAQGLAAVIAEEPDLTQERYAGIARHLFQGRSKLHNIGAAPDLVIQYMYPIEGNEAVIGLDYRNQADQYDAVKRAIETGEHILAGPVNLVQGGQGFIVRLPVYTDHHNKNKNRFWGVVSAVIDTNKLYQGSGLYSNALKIDIAIRGKDALGENGEIFFGQPNIFATDPVLLDVALPYGSWQIAAIPKGGWSKNMDDVLLFRITLIAMGLLILFPFIILSKTHKKKQESDTRLRGLFELSPIGIALNDYKTGRFIEVNDALVAPTGYTTEEFLKLSYWDLTPPEYTDDEVFQLECLERYRQYGPYEKEYIRKNGSRYPVLLRGMLIHDMTGRKLIWSIIEDITERKKIESDLVSARDEAVRANKAKSEFLSNMSHELRTPMNAILGFGQLMQMDDQISPRNKDYANEIVKAGDHLLELINDILDLAKIESGRIDMSLEPVSISSVVEESLDLMAAIAKKNKIQILCYGAIDTTVTADRVRLKQIILNLLSNAIKYNREGGNVKINIYSEDKKQLNIAFTDTGTGIPEAQQHDLFQPFNRLGAGKKAIEGTGIGLALTKRLIEQMNGSIHVDSKVDIGSTFTITLPLSPVALQEIPDDSQQTIDLLRNEQSAQAKHTVLCIEDNPANLTLIAQILKQRPVNFVSAHNPALGIELAQTRHPDLILLDINMPNMNGYQVLSILKQNPELEHIPIIAVTAKATQHDIKQGLEAGFSDYITKPLDVKLFLQCIDRYLTHSSMDF